MFSDLGFDYIWTLRLSGSTGIALAKGHRRNNFLLQIEYFIF